MTYHTNPFNQLPNGLTLLQVNPDCAAQLDARAKDYGWLYTKGADHAVQHRPRVRAVSTFPSYVKAGGGV